MPKSNLPQQNTIDQYIADGKTAIFNYTYLILVDNDMAVYVTNPGDEANPDKDLQVLNQDYTVQNAGTMTGGTITFVKGKVPIAGSIVTLVRSMQVGIETEFGNAQSFNGHTLDAAFERILLIMQEFNTQINKNNLQYIINSYLTSNLANKLPILTAQDNQVWVSQGGNIIAAQIENTDVSTLRSELASQAPNGGDGTALIGYYKTLEKQGSTLHAYLNQLEQKIATLSEASIQTGDFILTGVHITERKGFLLMNGSAISRTDYAALFAAIGTQFGAGDSKTTFNIPNFCRRALVGSGGTATPILNNTVGSAGGEETHKNDD
ncbi:phage tail protein [Rickettsiella massiliensis]|uniref:phage tail protein n=1 Tax=Rickettsiella massiliensis TaxID=676517 RepID=UPI00029AEE14|nr:phage tail protein [Rickettsiella massiliensis]